MGYCKRKGIICQHSERYCSECIDAKCIENVPDFTVEDVLSDLRSTYSFSPKSFANTLLLRAATLIETYRDLYTKSISKFDPFTAGLSIGHLQHEAELKAKETEIEKQKTEIEQLRKENQELHELVSRLIFRL